MRMKDSAQVWLHAGVTLSTGYNTMSDAEKSQFEGAIQLALVKALSDGVTKDDIVFSRISPTSRKTGMEHEIVYELPNLHLQNGDEAVSRLTKCESVGV